MVFKSDKQRKAVMAQLNNQPRANIQPTFIQKTRERLRKRFRPTSEELRQQRGQRLQTEAEQLKEAKIRTQQLELEARVESERESVRQREQEARTRLSEIDRARRERTFAGRAITTGRVLAVKGLERLRQPIKQPRGRRRKAVAKPQETGFFGINGETKGKKRKKEVGAFGIEF